MHIPDGFLSPGIAATTWLVAGSSIALALRAERADPTPMPSVVLGSVAAFLFAAQMVNVPVAAGTSGHLVGAMLAAVLLGPWRAMLAVASVLVIQAFLFQDGGMTALGANFIDMGLAGCLAGYAVAHLAGRFIPGPRGIAAGAILGGFASTLCGAALVSVWLSASGLFPFSGILPVMLVTHVVIGLIEAALTGAIVVTLLRVRPDLAIGTAAGQGGGRMAALGGGVFGVALTIAAFVAPLASSRPDGLEATARALGFADRARTYWQAPMPDYRLPWIRLAVVAPAAAGVLGTLGAALLALAISRSLARHDDASHR